MRRIILSLLVSSVFVTMSITKEKSVIKTDNSAPELFAKDVISTEDDEFGSTFSPDGLTCFFAKKSPSTLKSSTVVICFSKFFNGKWSKPEMAPFSGQYKDFNPCFSPDGKKLFFISNRPSPNKQKPDADIWMVENKGNAWSEPMCLPSPVNSKGYELGCSVAANGNIYFSSTRENGNLDIYRSKLLNEIYQEPENLGAAINSPVGETDPFIAPDESYLLFCATGREDALASKGAVYPRSDIYVSFWQEGKWSTAKNVGAKINSDAEETNPSVSGDGKYLFFTSERNFVSIPMKTPLTYHQLEQNLHGAVNGLGDIYRASMSDVLK